MSHSISFCFAKYQLFECAKLVKPKFRSGIMHFIDPKAQNYYPTDDAKNFLVKNRLKLQEEDERQQKARKKLKSVKSTSSKSSKTKEKRILKKRYVENSSF
jgi:hypothetical protein